MGLYRGLSAPLATDTLTNTVVFGVSAGVQRWLLQRKSLNSLDSGQTSTSLSSSSSSAILNGLSYCDVWLSGAVAGGVNCFVITPVELVKCRLQVLRVKQEKGALLAEVRHILHQDGVRGLYRGLGSTLARDVHSFGVYFASYEFARMTAARWWLGCEQEVDQLGPGWVMLAGGLGGTAAWLTAYPMDVVKTRVQVINPPRTGAEPLQQQPSEWSRWLAAAQACHRELGWRGFFRGLPATLLRAFPVNAAIFGTYELMMRLLHEGRGASS
jgi:hypothetical protein